MAVRRGPNSATSSLGSFGQSAGMLGQTWTQIFTMIAGFGNSLQSGATGGYGGGYGGGGYYKMVTDFLSGLF